MRNPAGFEYYPGRRLPAVCRDGVTRQAVCTGYAGQGLPAAVQVYVAGKRRTVSGTIYPLPFSRLLSFYATGRNSDLIPLTSHKPRLARSALRLIKATAYGPLSKGLPSDHAAALADVCRTEAAGLTEPPGQAESPGWIAYRVLRRMHEGDLKRLAVFFDRLARFQSAAGE